MNIDTSLFSELHLNPNLTSVFINNLGNEHQEEFYRRAIVEANKLGIPDVARQAEAWLDFSVHTRTFNRELSRRQRRRNSS